MSADLLTIADVSIVEVKHLAAIGTLPGVRVLLAAGGNGPGTGYLHYDPTLGLAWRAPGASLPGPWRDISAGNGTYVVEGADRAAFLRVQVYETYLPPEADATPVYLGDLFQNAAGDVDVSPAAAAAGDVRTRYFRLQNNADRHIHQVKAWLDAGVEHIEISPDNVTYTAPTTEAAALSLGDVAPGAELLLYFKRTIPAGHGEEPALLNLFHFTFYSP